MLVFTSLYTDLTLFYIPEKSSRDKRPNNKCRDFKC